MKYKKLLRIMALALFLCLAAGVGLFLYNANHDYSINSNFTMLPLQFNPDDSSSAYRWQEADITVYGAFIKGIQKSGQGDSLVIRALSPLPSVKIRGGSAAAQNLSLTIENINPDYYASAVGSVFQPVRIAVNALQFTVSLNTGEEKELTPAQPGDTESGNYVILGDSRDGYETFDQIIEQVNALNPVFVVNNGDLVFGGQPNQYRVYDQTTAMISTTLLTTLGNHDIRASGRGLYTRLYGPGYYSFDFGRSHFVFVDSSPGFVKSPAVTEEQYAWLERDLIKAQGKRIFIITHVPPVDPRTGTQPNEAPLYQDQVKQGNGYFEQKLENYNESVSLDHGFEDKNEAARFESLMTKYQVNTVYLSHIHSYIDYTKDGVRYLISGGAGAELLTKNSYYHYLIVKMDEKSSLTMVQLPSPVNKQIKRYTATASLFIKAMFKENRAAMIFLIAGLVLLFLLLAILLAIRWKRGLHFLGTFFRDTGKFMAKRWKELRHNLR